MRALVRQVVAFAAEPFRGNPAFVVSLEEDAPAELLRAVAAQLGGGVTAVLGPRAGGDALRLRFATAAGPHPGAGHAATAAAAVALEGRGAVDVILDGGERRRLWREADRVVVPWPAMAWGATDAGAAVGAALGLAPELCLAAAFGYVAIYSGEADVRALEPDMPALAGLDRDAVIATAPGSASDIAVRVFAPKVGLPEDPVCGTAHRIVAPFWAERLGKRRLHSRHLSTRGGDLWCALDGATVAIAGQTCRFLDGELWLPG